MYCTEKVNLFKFLDKEGHEKLHKIITPLKFDEEEMIILEEDVAENIYVLHTGKVKLNTYDINGKENILDILEPGDTIGEEAFFERKRYEYNAVAIEKCELCKISKKNLYEILVDKPEFSVHIIEHLSEKIKSSNEKIKLLMENDALKRIAIFLLDKGNDIAYNIDDIAASVNIRRETVSRKISTLQSKNLILRIGQSKIKILNRVGLKNILLEE